MIQRPDWEAASSRTVRPVTCHTHGCRALEKWVVQNAKWNQTHTGFWILNTKKKSISVKIFIFGLCWNSSLGDLKIVKIISSFFFNLFKCGYQNICHHTWFILYFHWKAPLWNTLGAGRGGEGTLQSILHKLLDLCSTQLKPFYFSFAHHTSVPYLVARAFWKPQV